MAKKISFTGKSPGLRKKTYKPKKESTWDIWAVTILILILLIAIAVLLIIKEEFNPDLHDCDECWEKEYLYKFDSCPVSLLEEENVICKKFSKKPFCELCINDWTDECSKQCKCEEFVYSKEDNPEWFENCCITIRKGMTYKFLCVMSEEEEGDEITISNEENDLLEKSINLTLCKETPEFINGDKICTSTVPKSPCEKNQEGWIFDCPGGRLSCGADMNTGEKECVCIVSGNESAGGLGVPSICREKTIYDETCLELESIYLHDILLIKEDGWFIDTYYSKRELWLILKEKGCEI